MKTDPRSLTFDHCFPRFLPESTKEGAGVFPKPMAASDSTFCTAPVKTRKADEVRHHAAKAVWLRYAPQRPPPLNHHPGSRR